MGTETERREHPRIPFDELLYTRSSSCSTKLQGTNLSAGGIFVLAEDPLPLGSIVEFEAQFLHRREPLILKSRGMGLEFVGLSEEAEKTLVNYILHRQIRSSSRSTASRDARGASEREMGPWEPSAGDSPA